MKTNSTHPEQQHRPRRSACASRSNAFELARIRSLSVAERIKTALTIGQRFAWLQPKQRTP
jgi:hypothetical protein